MRFIGTFVRYGTKAGYKGRLKMTLLFENICDKDGLQYTEHLWFNTGSQFEALNLQAGDKICFDARVKAYTKGYKGRRHDFDTKPVQTDYKLSHPTNIVKHIEGSKGQLF